MVPLTAPLLLAGGAAAAAVLVAIYFFQRRHRERKVSSLLLWSLVRSPAAGGRRREPLRLPATFWLELAALALLALAAAGPLLPAWHHTRPLVIVLDDSLSMQLARERGRAAVEGELRGGGHSPVRVILAGDLPRTLGAAASSDAEALRQMDGWTCGSPSSDLDAAVAFALRSGGPDTLFLVVTDHAPSRPITGGRVKWIAVGEAVANVAFIGAARSSSEHDRVTFEVANFASQPQSTPFTIASGGRILSRSRLDLAAGARRRIDTDLPPGTGPIEASIAGGAPFDDRVMLMPERRPPVRVRLDVSSAVLRDLVKNALDASQRAVVVESAPELLVADHPTAPDGHAWRLELDPAKAASAFLGPFTVDRTHPLIDGVAFEGVIWGAAAKPVRGRPVMLATTQPLITDEALDDGTHVIHVVLDPASSNVQRSTAWPAIVWNLLDWRSGNAPGFRYANVPLGGTAIARIDDDPARGTVRAPDGTSRDVEAYSPHTLVISASQPGIWTLRTKSAAQRFVCNALVPEESDFSHAAKGTWGGWSAQAMQSNGFADGAWIALLVALLLLVAQQRLVAEGTP